MTRTVDIDWATCNDCSREVEGKQAGKDIWVECPDCDNQEFLLS